MKVRKRIYVVRQHDHGYNGLGKALGDLNTIVLIPLLEQGQKAPCVTERDVVGVYIADEGNFGGKHIKTFHSLQRAKERKFVVPKSLRASLGKTHVSLMVIRRASLGTQGLIDALKNAHHRDSQGKWHGPKTKRIRKAKPDCEPPELHRVYALS